MKKFLKILFSIIGLLVFVFLATGLLVKETAYEVSVTIERPVEEVFKEFNDPTKIKNWIPTIKTFEVIDEKEGKVGNTYKIIVDENGNDFEMKETIIEFELNKKVALEYIAQGMFKTDVITFIPDGNRTTIVNKASCKGTTYFLKCTFPYFKKMFKNIDQEYLDNFKAFIEK